MNSENKSLLVISVGPKTARPRVPALSRESPCPRNEPARRPRRVQPVQPPHARRRASSEQQRSKVGFPIRRFSDQSLFAAPRNLSQRTTSFIASQRQGIHQIPLWHLIALIAKARFYLSPTRRRRQTNSGVKRPVLLQTHPGILAVSQRTRDWCLSDDRKQRTESRYHPSSVVCHPSSDNRMRFLFTMSDIERPSPQRGQSLPTPPPR